LSLVQQIAREHGGRVEVDTNPGKGSRFSLILPKSGGLGRASSGEKDLCEDSPGSFSR
jgi:nitrogen-specific signal transduction histidine kinase